MPALFLIVFIDLVGFGIVLPLQPFYAREFGVGPDVITLVAASYTAMQFVMAPVWGRVSDRIGRRPVMLITVAGSCIGYLGLAFSESLLMLFLARAFGGAMAANMGVAHAYVADITDPRDRARGMGRIGAAAGLGFVMGPAIGGWLAGTAGGTPDFQLPFFAAALFSGIALVLAVVLLPETTTESGRAAAAEGAGTGRFRAILASFSRPPLGLLVMIAFVSPFVFSGIETVFALWTDFRFGWGPGPNGVMYTYMGAVAVLTQGLLVGPLTRLLGERPLIVLGGASVMLGAFGMPFSTGYPLLLVTVGLLVFGVSVAGPALSSLVSQYADPHSRGTTLGLTQSSGGLGRIAGPALSGAAFQHLGPDWPFFAGAIAMTAMIAMGLLLVRRYPAEADRDA